MDSDATQEADMTQTRAGWRTLAEPTYGVSERGEAVRLDAGTLARPYEVRGVDPASGYGVKRGPEGTSAVLFRDARRWDEPYLAYVTASALRFEEEG